MKPSKLLLLARQSHDIPANLGGCILIRGFVLFFALLISTKSIAENEPIWAIDGVQALALVQSDAIEVRIFDSVNDGCMSSPNEVKQAALVQLSRNNFKTAGSSNDMYLDISAIGGDSHTRGGHNLGCAVFVNG